MLRIFKLAKASAIKALTQTINQPENRARGGRPPAVRNTLRAEPTCCSSVTAHNWTSTPLRYHQRRCVHPAATGPAHRAAHQLDPRPGTPDHHRRHQPHSSIADPPRHRPRQRRGPAHRRRRQPRPAAQRGLLRRPVRRQPAGSILEARPAVTASTAAATDKPTPRSSASPCAGYAGTPAPATTSFAASPKAKPAAKPSAASSATSPAKSIGSSHPHPKRSPQLLDIHRGISAGCTSSRTARCSCYRLSAECRRL
jgi:hypothetical protein